MSAAQKHADAIIREAVDDALASVEPLRINTAVTWGPVMRHLLNRARHVHTMTGQCLVNRAGAVCVDEFDWFKANP